MSVFAGLYLYHIGWVALIPYVPLFLLFSVFPDVSSLSPASVRLRGFCVRRVVVGPPPFFSPLVGSGRLSQPPVGGGVVEVEVEGGVGCGALFFGGPPARGPELMVGPPTVYAGRWVGDSLRAGLMPFPERSGVVSGVVFTRVLCVRPGRPVRPVSPLIQAPFGHLSLMYSVSRWRFIH